MKSNSSRGRSISNDTHVQSLFMNITNMHSQLLKYVQEQDDMRGKVSKYIFLILQLIINSDPQKGLIYSYVNAKLDPDNQQQPEAQQS